MPYIPKERKLDYTHPGRYSEDANTAFMRGKSAGAPGIPVENSAWHPVAQGWYRSLRMSGQSQWYEASDWATAWVAAEVLDRLYRFGFSATLLAEWNEMAKGLACSLGDRRRLRIELVRGDETDADEEAASDAVAALKGELVNGRNGNGENSASAEMGYPSARHS